MLIHDNNNHYLKITNIASALSHYYFHSLLDWPTLIHVIFTKLWR